MRMLFQDFNLPQAAIEQASRAASCACVPFLSNDEKLNEVVQILSGKSIRLPVDQVPSQPRGLLSDTEEMGRISPVELLKQEMSLAFDASHCFTRCLPWMLPGKSWVAA